MCRICHALGHLFRDCPLTQKSSLPDASDKPKSDGFTKVPNRRRNNKKAAPNPRKPQASSSNPSTSNGFEALARELDLNPENPDPSEQEAKKEKQIAHTDSKLIPEVPMLKDTFSANLKAPKWYIQGMEVDNT